jgi:hypothetical protein
MGKIQLAHKGTLFLDDIDCMPTRMQVSLLRVGSRIFAILRGRVSKINNGPYNKFPEKKVRERSNDVR